MLARLYNSLRKDRPREQIDFEKQPPQFKVSDTHWAATWLLHPEAPKVDPPKIVLERIERMKKLQQKNSVQKGGQEG